MALVINSNIASLNAQRQLTQSGAALDQSSERLASGKRINSAADDAAGLSIANRQTSQIRGLDQAIRNANDGISLIQTAEGALDESTNILQRIRELSVQGSNGIYSDSDRSTLDAEVQQLVAELDRISETTSFNGQKILDGTQGSIALQVGSEANETISFEIGAINSSSLGLGSTSSNLSGDSISDLTGLNATDNTAVSYGQDDVLINGQGLSAFDGSKATPDTLQTIIDDINTNVTGVSASGFNVVEAGVAGTGILGDDQALTISVFNVSDNSQTDFTISTSTDLADLASKINTATGGIVDASVNDNGRLVLSNDTGAAIGLSASGSATSSTTLDTVLGISTSDVSDQGGSNPTVTTEFATGGTDAALFTGNLALSSDDGSDISITKGANGTDTDLANLGFRETSSGEVNGIALSSGSQSTALAAGDLVVNGTTIAATTSAEGLQGKVDNINAVSATTGVVANVTAEQSYSYNAASAPAEVQAQNAYAASASTAALELHFADAAAPSGFLALNESVSFVVTSSAGADTVTLEANKSQLVGTDLSGDFNLTGQTVDFTIADDSGAASATISVVAADYGTGDGLAAAVQAAIDVEGSQDVTVTYDTDHLVFTSNVTGTTSDVILTAVGPADAEAALGFTSPTTGTTSAAVINNATELVTAINLDLVAGGSTAEAYLDDNSRLAFRETATTSSALSIGTLTVNDTVNDNANVNDIFGFDFAQTSTGAASYTGASASFSVNGTDIDLSTAQSDGSISAVEIAEAVNDQTGATGVTAYVDENDKLHFASDSAFTLGEDANQSGFVSQLDSGGSLVAGTHNQSFSEIRGTAVPTDFDFSGGAANNVAFAVDDGTADTTVTLTTSLTDLAGVVDEINTQLSAGGNSVEAFADEEGFLAFRKTTSSNEGNFTLTAGTVGSAGDLVNATGISTIEASASTSADRTGSIQINGFEVTGISLGDKDAAVTTLNAAQANTGVTASLDENGEIKLSGNSAITLEVGNDDGVALGKVLGVDFIDTDATEGVLDSQTVNAAIELKSINEGSPISVEVTADGATATGLKDLNTDLSGTVTGSALSSVSVGTASAAQAAIDSIDNALETINSTRSELGAINNRLDFTVSNLSNVSENTSAARSRIVDTDFAAETAALSRAQVLQQASQAILAQANAAPQQVLQLLQG
jgi:flagellin